MATQVFYGDTSVSTTDAALSATSPTGVTACTMVIDSVTKHLIVYIPGGTKLTASIAGAPLIFA